MKQENRHNTGGGAGNGTQNGSHAREAILEAVRRARLPAVPLPAIAGVRDACTGDPVSRFMVSAKVAAAAVQIVETGSVETAVRERFPEGASIATTSAAWSFDRMDARTDAHTMAQLDVLVCPGELGVAENGAVWLGESGMGPRAAPFLTQHLVLVLDRSAIVSDMHAAYDRLDVAREGYGVFVAGPSKTADIEQTLVIGAHGPRSLTVLLTQAARFKSVTI